ncbi:hypothetical protein SAMN05421678_111131 [Actinopolymorpha cephalotaxi]|uniref:Ribosomal protein S18 acetylase RimI-like enzyme n=1 Tax=Actinopolymorpha cephalotaxi TaxID=504797 RepID=A0A1I2WYM4_9ACTN|nr:hypothetical protein [Actinopolymorpha cephalotaxi]NYH85160.1 ribosomal protein S18 acetylase RimI-like enzyme [Actinopolymorpha cephalotaxi]SFH05536.1 hypothetical protein SAMN05421678_111131 [Actinopolymorpha cephalotaxi]
MTHRRLPAARELARCFLAAQHPVTRQWVDDAVRLDLLTANRAEDVTLATDLELAALRARRFAPHLPAETFLNRWTEVEGDLAAMMSMRYEGGDPRLPFVDATVTSRPFTARDLPALAKAGAEAYPALRPRYLRLWSARPVGWFAGTGSDRRFLAGPVAALRAGFERTPPTELTLTPATTLEHYEDAERAYADVDVNHPLHPTQATIADREALAETLAAGMLFDVRVGADWAGYVAVTTTATGDTLGMPAYVVQELVLARRFRGRGFGPHLTTLLARALPDDGRRVLVGTVHSGNRGAREAAERAGRVDVGGWIQVPLATA